MARRRKKRTRRKFTGINGVNLLEAYLQASVGTETLFNVNPIEFVMGVHSKGLGNFGPASGVAAISLRELFQWDKYNPSGSAATTMPEQLMKNVRANWLEGVVKSVGIGIGFKFGKKLLKKPRAAANRTLKQIGLGDTLRV
jgi:hypothetical protein